MQSSRIRVPLLAAFLLGAPVLLLARGPSAAPEPARIGTVDVFRVLQEARPFVTADQELRAWIDQEKASLEKAKSEVQTLEARLDVLDPGGDEARALRREVERKKFEFEQDFKARDEQRLKRIGDSRRAAFARVQEVVATVAGDRQLNVVLQLHGGELSGRTQAELSSEIYLRNVLYSHASLDITEDVLSLLNR